MVTSETYHDFDVFPDIEVGTPLTKIRKMRKNAKKESNKVRSLANKHLKAFIKGRGQVNQLKRNDQGFIESQPIKITSNEFRVHKKV